jgi:hypothetical protein
MIILPLNTRLSRPQTKINKKPNNFEEAIGQPVWCKAMQEELNALEKNMRCEK